MEKVIETASIVEYKGDVAATIEEARPLWRDGKPVLIVVEGRLYTFWDFVVATRRADDDPIREIVGMYIHLRDKKRAYSTRVMRLIKQYSEQVGMDREKAKSIFYQMRMAGQGEGEKYPTGRRGILARELAELEGYDIIGSSIKEGDNA